MSSSAVVRRLSLAANILPGQLGRLQSMQRHFHREFILKSTGIESRLKIRGCGGLVDSNYWEAKQHPASSKEGPGPGQCSFPNQQVSQCRHSHNKYPSDIFYPFISGASVSSDKNCGSPEQSCQGT